MIETITRAETRLMVISLTSERLFALSFFNLLLGIFPNLYRRLIFPFNNWEHSLFLCFFPKHLSQILVQLSVLAQTLQPPIEQDYQAFIFFDLPGQNKTHGVNTNRSGVVGKQLYLLRREVLLQHTLTDINILRVNIDSAF